MEALENIIFGYKKDLTNADEMYTNAAEQLSEYNYRKLFGLSKQDMLNEPLEDYFLNSFISTKISEKEQQDIKRSNSKGGKIGT